MRPFRIDVPDAEIDELRRRVAATRWPAEPADAGWDRGVPQAYLRELAEFWVTEFDWRAVEARLNSHPQYVTRIDGADVHFLHVRSPEPNATPMIMTHGWPSTVAEFLDVIGPLTDPRAHGLDPAGAVHLVLPSLPGHGFSGPPPGLGWDVRRVADAWAELMNRLGYDRYVAQGGDWGYTVSLHLALQDPEHVRGVHLSMLATLPLGGADQIAALRPDERERLDDLVAFEQEAMGWQKIQSTRPRTVGYGLTDSPVGQLAWIVEKFKEWSDSDKAPEDAVSRTDILTAVSIYWFTATAASSAEFYYESTHLPADFARTWGGPWPVRAPVAVAVSPADATRPIRRWAEDIIPTLTRWTEFRRGGHFAALEHPEQLATDIADFVRTLHP